MKEIKIVIPNFAREIKVSNNRRASYYKEGEKIPKKYQNKFYTFLPYKGKMILFDNKTKCPVIKNPNTAGTPKFTTIAGNDLWNTHRVGNYIEKIKLSLQIYFWDVIKHFKLENLNIESYLPMRITFDFYTYKETQDLDNLALFYQKSFADAIQDKVYPEEKRWIKKDDVKTIKSYVINHHDVESKEKEQLIITITKVENCNVIDYTTNVLQLNTDEINGRD
jgi:hypothetical protein